VTLIYLEQPTEGLATTKCGIIPISENFDHITSAGLNLKLGKLEIAERGFTAVKQIIMAAYLLNRYIL
jgi:hypothetical protein